MVRCRKPDCKLKVLRNKGAGGIDGMQVGALGGHLKANWSAIEKQLMRGSTIPKQLRR